MLQPIVSALTDLHVDATCPLHRVTGHFGSEAGAWWLLGQPPLGGTPASIQAVGLDVHLGGDVAGRDGYVVDLSQRANSTDMTQKTWRTVLHVADNVLGDCAVRGDQYPAFVCILDK